MSPTIKEDKSSVEYRVFGIIDHVQSQEKGSISRETKISSFDWDSIDTEVFLEEMEIEFSLDGNSIKELKTVGEIIDYIEGN